MVAAKQYSRHHFPSPKKLGMIAGDLLRAKLWTPYRIGMVGTMISKLSRWVGRLVSGHGFVGPRSTQ
ncbi:hypothetical protein SH449x_000834 [Pirellulaceae bacterium SH449]